MGYDNILKYDRLQIVLQTDHYLMRILFYICVCVRVCELHNNRKILFGKNYLVVFQ